MKKRLGMSVAATVSSIGLVFGGATVAFAAAFDVNATTDVYTTTGTGYDTESTDNITGTLECVPGKTTYNLGFQGRLNMDEVKSEWARLRQTGIDLAYARSRSNPLVALMYPTKESIKADLFDTLIVSSDFTISFVLERPDLLTIDTSMVDTPQELAASYEADNTQQAQLFSRAMVPTSGFVFDQATGTLSASFKLRDGLTAKDLDLAYDAMTGPLIIKSPVGMITMTSDQYKTVDGLASDGTDIPIVASNPRVEGKFSATSQHALLGGIINNVMAQYFPMSFGQNVTGNTTATVLAKSDLTYTYSFMSEGGLPMPAGVESQLPSPVVNKTLADPAPVVANNLADVEVEGGTWKFLGWKAPTALAWNDDAALAEDCKLIQQRGMWKFVEKEEPVVPPTPTNPTNPAKPTTEPTVKKTVRVKKLAHTGAQNGGLIVGSAFMILLGGAALAVSRKRS